MKPGPLEIISVNDVDYAHQDIEKVVNDFYTQVAQDPILKVPFQSVHDWPEHIARMTHFWWIRFGGPHYMFSEYNPALKHFHAGFNADLLKLWLGLFKATLKADLNETQADLWGQIAERIGQGLTMRNEMLIAAYGGSKA